MDGDTIACEGKVKIRYLNGHVGIGKYVFYMDKNSHAIWQWGS